MGSPRLMVLASIALVVIAACAGGDSATTQATASPSATGSPSATTSTATTSTDTLGPLAFPRGSVLVSIVEVIDGDTVDVQFGSGGIDTVRLIGINSPESGECYADEATEALEGLLTGVDVAVTSDVSDRDQFDRLLRYLWLEDGTFVNEDLVAGGFALAREFSPDTAHAGELQVAQQDARAAGVGLWARDACGPAADANVLIVGIHFDAPGNDNDNLNEEWVLIHNRAGIGLDFTGWVLKDESATHRYSFPASSTLAPDTQLQVFTGCGTDTATALYWCNPGAVWNNDGDTGFLLDHNGNIAALWAYDENTQQPAPITITTTTNATTTTTEPPTPGAVEISWIEYDACGNDVECYNDTEYVELENTSGAAVDISRWYVIDEANHRITIPNGYSIPAGGTFRIYTGSGDNDPASAYFDGRGQAIWNNSGGDTATLFDGSGEVVDTYSYSS